MMDGGLYGCTRCGSAMHGLTRIKVGYTCVKCTVATKRTVCMKLITGHKLALFDSTMRLGGPTAVADLLRSWHKGKS